MKRKNIVLSALLSAVMLVSSCSGNTAESTTTTAEAVTVSETEKTAATTEDTTTETQQTSVETTIAVAETSAVDESVTTTESETTTENITVTEIVVSETTKTEAVTTIETTVSETTEVVSAEVTTTTEETKEETTTTTVKEEAEETTMAVTEKKYIALTFDDGPNTTTTNEVLDVLEQYGVKGSFFLVGNNINSATESVVKRAYDMGCEIGNHSKTHSYMNEMADEDIVAEIEYVNDYVEKITGEAPKFFRPPYIAVNNTMYDLIDMPFICGFGCNDWDDKVTAERRAKVILRQVQDGGIILLHDAQGNSKTVEALHTIIPELQAQGYEFVTVSELFEIKGVEINPNDGNLYTFVGQ